MKKHQKHANITKPTFGKFGRNEVSILGTPCSNIKKLSYILVQELSTNYKIGYVDADHKGADEEGISSKSSLNYNASMEFVDKINFNRFDTIDSMNEYQWKKTFNSQDLVIVNGNHFKSNAQIIVIDSKKPLEKKLEKLTNVELILLEEGENEIPGYLENHLPNFENIPILHMNDVDKIVSFMEAKMKQVLAPINGLVLAGGKSTRMLKDKGKIEYHGKEQRLFMLELLAELTEEAYLSIRAEQTEELNDSIATIEDKFIGLGPYGAILSAFQHNPNSAWLITACDQPLLRQETLNYLISKRNPSKVATAFYNPETDFPEPLITIWEPRAYPELLFFLSLGYSCPRKVLINSEIELVKLEDASVLRNANTPEEYEKIKQTIN